MRAILSKVSVLLLAAGLAGSAIVTGCSSNVDDKSQGPKDQGTVGFQLDVGGGATINTMHVVVYGNSLGAVGASTNIVRDLDVGGISGPTASFTLTLPAGTNYQVKLSSPENVSCGGTGTFNVIAGQANSSTLSVTMSCASTDTTGGQTIDATACTPPVVNSVFVGPNTQAVGHNIQLQASVEGGSTVQWTQSGVGAGTFVSSSAASTNFTCTTAGAVTIQLGLTKNGCATAKSYSVSCTGSGGGAGGAGGAAAGGATNGGGGATNGGGGATNGGGGATNGGGGATNGGGGATNGGGGATNGGGGATNGGGGAGGAVAGANNGGGGTNSAGAGGCPGPVHNSTGAAQLCSAAFAIDECGTSCAQITTNACQACELADTSSCYDDGDNTDGSSLLNMKAALAFYGGANDAARVSKGIAVEQCMYRTGCAKQAGQIFTTCYCGTSGGSCTTPGAANGPCKAEIEAATEATAPLDVASHIGDPTFPGGIAQIRLACDKTQCAAACLN